MLSPISTQIGPSSTISIFVSSISKDNFKKRPFLTQDHISDNSHKIRLNNRRNVESANYNTISVEQQLKDCWAI